MRAYGTVLAAHSTPETADILLIMSDSAPSSNRNALIAIVALLALALVVGGIVVVKSASGPSAAQANGGGVGGVGAESIEAALAAAQVYIRDKKFVEAATILEKLVERAPTDQAAHLAYAQALLGQKKYPEAYAEYEAAIALNQTISSQRLKEGAGGAPVRDPVTAQLHFEAGTCANVVGRSDRAIEHYWMAQTLDASEPRYPLFLAMMQIKTGDEGAANASLVRAVKLNPDLAEAWGTMAELALRQNQLSLAAQHVEKARTLQPEVARWRIIEARIANRTGEPEKAATMLVALDAQTRSDRQVITLLSESYGLMKRPGDAAKLWADAAKNAGADADAHYQAALWYQRAGDSAKAAEHAKTAAMMGHEGAKQLATDLAHQ